jgi:hypothetical protein
MLKFKKILFTSLITIIIFVVIVIVFISPITKYVVEKYDEKFTGRQITMNWAFVIPFTGYIHLNGVKIYEEKSDSIFISADGISLDFEMYKLLSKTYQISKITLDKPRGYIVQHKKEFNFNDLIEKFKSKEPHDTTQKPVHFSILSIKINDGEFYYREKSIPINYFIKKINLVSTGIRWDTDTIATKFSFLSGLGMGNVKGDITINTKTLDYRVGVVVQKFELRIIEQFLKQLTNYGTFRANLDADIKARGNFKNKEDIIAKGYLAINDFHFGKNPKDDYASFDKLAFQINELSPKHKKYLFDSVSINRPYFKYERYDYLNNIETIFGKKGANVKAVNADASQFNLVIEIAKYIEALSKNFFKSNYKVNRLAVYKGNLIYNDYSQSEKFTIGFNPLSIFADSINKNKNRVNISLKSGIKPYGNASVTLSISPKDLNYFDMGYQIQNVSVPMFNPYIISFTSFPLDRGTIKINGNWNVKAGVIQSDNHLLVLDPRLSSRLKNKELKWLPMRLLMFFIREQGNVIDFQVPITGSLKDPKFHLSDVIYDVIKNIFVKPATIPYQMEVTSAETEVEKSLTVKWRMHNNSLEPNHKKFVERMADFLKKNPEATITVSPKLYALKEKEYILFFEAKKKYFLHNHKMKIKSFAEEDSIEVEKMSVKDTLFVQYLNKQLHNAMLFTIQEKCAQIIDSSHVISKLNRLNKQRKATFLSYFRDNEVEKQVKFSSIKTTIPFYGFSFYKIEYKGEFPESVKRAYRKMNQLNAESPREKFRKERIKNNSSF